MGFFGNLFFQNGIGKAIDPFELTPLGADEEESNLAGFKVPEFKADPNVAETQDVLKEIGFDLLGGDTPDFLKSIGETGSVEFENMLSLLKGDVASSVESSAAAIGRSGGAVTSQVGEKVGRLSTELRFKDLLRANEGKKFLFKEGRGITEGVRGAAQTQQAQENQFNLNASEFDFRQRVGLDKEDAAEGAATAKLVQAGLGAAVGFATGGPVGAVIGATGGLDFTSLLKGRESTTPVGGKSEFNFGQIPLSGARKAEIAKKEKADQKRFDDSRR